MEWLVHFFLIISASSALLAQQNVVQEASDSNLKNPYQILILNKAVGEGSDIAYEVIQLLNLRERELELVKTIQSKTATYQTYQLKVNSYPVYGALIKVAVSKEGKITSIRYPHSIYKNVQDKAFPEKISPNINRTYRDFDVISVQRVYLPQQDQLIPTLLIELTDNDTKYLQLISDSESILHLENMVKFFRDGPNDTIVNSLLFNPDPLTTSNKTYGVPYNDANDTDSPELNNQRISVSLKVSYIGNRFMLENDYVAIRELSRPKVPVAESNSPSFIFTRSESGFEDVMVLFHITTFKEHLNKLGYGFLPGFRIEADPHALYGADQSVFHSKFNPPRLLFGEGGVDDAEDADVIVHEYAHALIYGAIGNSPNNTIERETIEEAVCDYFAASYSKVIDSFNFDKIYNWDGHNEFLPGREGSSSKDYQNITFTTGGGIYQHTDILVSCLLAINQSIGRELADELALEAIYNLSPGTTMPQFARDVIWADSTLNGGNNFFSVYNAFVSRNILPVWISLPENRITENIIELRGSINFAYGRELVVYSPKSETINIELYSMNGTGIKLQLDPLSKSEISVGASELETGIYLLKIYTENGNNEIFKVARF